MSMLNAKFVVHYHEVDDEGEPRKALKNYIALFSPDVGTLADAVLQASYLSPKITVVRTPSVIYVAPGEYEIEGKAYEFLVGKEDGLRKVAEEILGVKRLKLDTVVNIVQAVLWALVLLLGYLGYRNDVLKEASSYMIGLLALSWVIENFRRGYKKRERVRASAPHHASE
ncbi:MAG: hypothetical protein J7K48_10175 [Thermococcus sp.]|nr:hypothetical protein [Thermococcus sp.]